MPQPSLPTPEISDSVLSVRGSRLLSRSIRVRSEDTPTIVFLHEALGSIGQWKSFPQALCAAVGLNGLVFDRIGYGGSDPMTAPRTPDYLREQGEDWLPDVLASAGISQPPVLFGHSDGGSIALYFAAKHPTAAAISLAAHVILEPITVQGIKDFGLIWEHPEHGPVIASKLARYHGEKTEAVYRAWHDTWLKPEFAEFDMRPHLPSITCPTLVVQGEGDQYGSMQQVTDILDGIRRGSPTQAPLAALIPECGHIPHLEQPAVTIQKAREFLSACGLVA